MFFISVTCMCQIKQGENGFVYDNSVWLTYVEIVPIKWEERLGEH